MTTEPTWGNGLKVRAGILLAVARGTLPPELSGCPECGACAGVNIDCETCQAVALLWEGMLPDEGAAN